MLILNTILLLLGALGAIAFPLIYILSARWWINPIGRMLVGEGAVIALVYTKAVIAVFLGGHISTTLVSTAINAIVAAMLVGMSITIGYVIRTEKRR